VTWAIDEKGYSQRRACRLVGLQPKTYRYASTRPDDGPLRTRLRELASQRRRFGYRRLAAIGSTRDPDQSEEAVPALQRGAR
jgi:putative transposase